MPPAPPSSDAAVEARVFWLRFQKEIAAALIIVILAIIGFAGYRFYTYRRNSTSAELLGQAKTPNDYQAVIERFPEHRRARALTFCWRKSSAMKRSSLRQMRPCRGSSIKIRRTILFRLRGWQWRQISNRWEKMTKRFRFFKRSRPNIQTLTTGRSRSFLRCHC